MKRTTTFLVLVFIIAGVAACSEKAVPPKVRPLPTKNYATGQTEAVLRTVRSLPMKKYVTDQAGFVLYMPEGWKASEGTQGQFKTLFVTDPSGLYVVALFSGVSPTGKDVVALTRFFVGGIRKQFPDFTIQKAMISPDQHKIAFEGIYSSLQKKRKVFRAWVTGGDGNFSYSSIEAPEGKLAESRPLLLTILSNIGIMKGAVQTSAAPARILPLVQRRLPDGSAVFSAPQGWQYKSFGTGAFAATDPAGLSSFIVGTVEFLTPQLGVRVPNAIISNYLSPHEAMQLVTTKMNLASGMQFTEVIPRADIVGQIGRVYTSGPVRAEEFVYTFTAKGRRCKAYSFGITFGSRLNTNWKFWHITVAAPVEQFEALVPSFVSMVHSYKINDQFAQNYIAQGMARLRQMQQQTAQIVARNSQEIHQMMQSAYDERQKSMDYIDYQRTNYIRGQSDWISSVEGGSVYHSDSWGTKNTTTGEYYKGQPFNYFNSTGTNPKYNEQMQEINNRALYEAYKK
jgi:hypothetical protein